VTVQAISQQMAESSAYTPQELNVMDSLVMAFASSTGGQRDLDAEEMAGRLQKAVKDKACRVPSRMKSFSEVLDATSDFEFSIKGNGCPIDLSFKVRAELHDQERRVHLALKYKLSDKSLEELVEIKSWSLEGTLTIKAEVASDSPEDPKVVLSIKGDLKGDLSSVTDKDLKTSLTIKGARNVTKIGVESGKMEKALAITYSDFTGELKTVRETIDGREVAPRQFLNGKELSQDEFERMASAL